MGSKRRLILTVEGETLYNLVNPTESEVLSLCALSEDTGTPAISTKIKTDKFAVDIDKDVRWEGESVDSIAAQPIASSDSFTIENDYSISIDYVIYYPDSGDKDFFDSIILKGRGNPRKKRVTAKVKNSGLSPGDEYTYLIFFSIHPPRGFASETFRINEPKSFEIDPKLRIP